MNMDMKHLLCWWLIQGLAKENQLRLVLGPRSRLTYPHIIINIIKLLSLIMISIIFTIHLHPDDNDHRVLLVRSVGDSLTNVGEALHPASRWGDIFIFYIFIFSYLHPASRWGDFFIFYIFIFSYLHPASRWGIENQNCFSYRTAKKTISSGQGAQLPLLKSLVHRRLYGRTWLLHGSPWAKVLT